MTRISLVACCFALVACGTDGTPSPGGGGSDAGAAADAARAVDAAPPDAAQPAFSAIPLTSPDGSFWGPQVTLGNQTFMMDLDTGSTTVGVASTGCDSCSSAGISPLYNATSGVDQNDTAQTRYASGAGWSGEIYRDTIGLGHGTPSLPLNIVAIDRQSQFFFGGNVFQGIMGFGPAEIAEPGTGAFFSTLAGGGEPAIVAFELCDATGTMWLGGFDPSKASAAPSYTPLLTSGQAGAFYSIDVDSMSIGSTSVGAGAQSFGQPIVDTGTTLFYVPTQVEQAVLSAVNSSSGYQTLFGGQTLADGDCITQAGVTAAMVDAQLPPLTMTMPSAAGGADVSLVVKPMQSYLYDGGNGQFCFAMGDGGGVGVSTIMGDMIIRAFVTVIDVQGQRVGFAPDSGCANAPRRAILHASFHPHPPHHPQPRLR